MSNLADLLKDLGASDSDATKFTGDFLGTAADLSGYVSALQLIGGWIATDNNVSNSLNEIRAMLQQIGQQLGKLADQLEGQVAGSDKLQRMRDIDQGINPAVAVAAQLPAILSAHPPPTQDFKLAQIHICVEAVLFFSDYDDKWQVVRADFPYPLNTFSGWFAPPPETTKPGDLVFNYVYTLPQFLRSIGILLMTIRALDPSSLGNYEVVFTRALRRLESVHQTVVETGIIGTVVPDRTDFAGIRTSNDGREAEVVDFPRWVADPGLFPYGAVELHSGANNVSPYLPYLPYALVYMLSVTPEDYAKFQSLLRLRIEKQKKALYVDIGMLNVRQAIDKLRGLLGQPASSDPLYSAWSYLEVISILGLTLPRPIRPPHPILPPRAWPVEPNGLEDALRSFLLAIPPYVPTEVLEQGSPGVGGTTEPAIPLPSGSLYEFLTGTSISPIRL
jgi:hypothetical protein